MTHSRPRRDDPIRLDVTNVCLWRGKRRIALRPKDCDVLQALADHPGQVISKAALLNAGWPEVHVTEGVLKDSIYRLRRALGDRSRQSRFIETVPRRGYRLLHPISLVAASVTPEDAPPSGVLPAWLVGRQTVLTQLQERFASARQGIRQLGFVTGEVGIGKTTIVEAFLTLIARRENVQIMHGQCVQHYGSGEGYLPIFEALQQACKGPQGGQCLAVLRQLAPTWLVHMPGFLGVSEYAELQQRHGSSTRERMLRELVNALDALAAETPLVLFIEDLHWSDPSTLDAIALAAQRLDRSRLLLLGTFRPEDVLVTEHPLRNVLPRLRRLPQMIELALEQLTESDVVTYLAARFTADSSPVKLASALYHRSDGNPLFLVNTVDHLLAQGILYQHDKGWALRDSVTAILDDIPVTVREVIEQQQAMCSPAEQQIVRVASVAGQTFSAASVAAGMNTDLVETEADCERLAQRELFLQTQGVETWPDGTVATRYGFRHALYRQVLYEQIPAARRVQLHRRIGEREEIGYDTRSAEIASRLAMHFEMGSDSLRAVAYHGHAATHAFRRSAYQESIGHCRQGLEILAALPETPDRDQRELDLQTILGPVLMATKSPADPETKRAYARARTLCQQVGQTSELVWALEGLWAFYLVRGQLQTARELGQQLLDVAQHVQHEPIAVIAHQAMGLSLFYLGEFTNALPHLERGLAVYQSQRQPAQPRRDIHDPGVMCGAFAALARCFLGDPDQALRQGQEMLQLAHGISHPYSLAFAHCALALIHQCRQEAPDVQHLASVAIRLSSEQGFPLWLAMGTILHGWALAMQAQPDDGIRQIRRGLHIWRAAGAVNILPYYLVLLADAYREMAQIEEGLEALDEAMMVVDTTGERWWEAEQDRLRGEFLLMLPTPDRRRAERCFQRALEVSRHQQARLWEQRAAMSLSRLQQRQGNGTARPSM